MPTSLISAPQTSRLLAITLLALAALLALNAAKPEEAEGRGVWCSGDPAIVVNGSVVSITAHVPLDRLRDIDSVDFVFHVPSNADVAGVANDSFLFRASITVVKDLPAEQGLLGTLVVVDMSVKHRGKVFGIAASSVATGSGSNLWIEGKSTTGLEIQATGLLNLRLF